MAVCQLPWWRCAEATGQKSVAAAVFSQILLIILRQTYTE
jgi:hypothetical protein